jgi:hypothetical protein
VAFSKLFKMLDNKLYANRLGYEQKFGAYRSAMQSFAPLALAIERSCPAVASQAEDTPNVEYPWLLPGGVEWQAPCETRFQLGEVFREQAVAKQMLHFLKMLADRFHEIF